MRKNVIFSICMTLIAFMGFAQSPQKTTILIEKMQLPTKIGENAIGSIRTNILESFSKQNRFKVVDITTLDSWKKEIERQGSSDAMSLSNDSRISVATQAGADYILIPNINSVTTEYKRVEKGDNYYSGSLDYSLQLMSVIDGEVISGNYKIGGFTSTVGSTKEKAITQMAKQIELQVTKFIITNLPVACNIQELIPDKRGKLTMVMLEVGKEMGIKKSGRFEAFKVSKSSKGRPIKRSICKFSVQSVGEGYCECKSLKKKEMSKIISAFNQDPASIEMKYIGDSGIKILGKGTAGNLF
ncbi:penicillin-binding protein activator LpoB [Halosquirtibacter laminarini]|uniref:Penicillin-binding protein activator LpoB n=1 Tax=Halosquirtibacter laminarini TaxID=3374600 RepID=A0AC61NNF8_9BACT|nr:penicillin-binding protein activator LpoB [Prolixibacteraceae bacterium]